MLELAYLMMYSLVLITGVSIGSFLNVVIYRVPQNISIAKGRSFCPLCDDNIKTYDLIPVLSYLLLDGKCRNCKSTIAARYPVVESLTGLLYMIIFGIHGLTLNTLVYFAFTAILISIAFIDWDTMTIPDSLNIAILVIAILAIFCTDEFTLKSRIIGFFVVSAPMFLIAFCIPGAFGGGDIKMMAVVGLLLGTSNTVVAGFVGVLVGGFYAIYLMRTRDVKEETHMPFGPFLCVGCFVASLFGQQIADWYLGLLF